MLARLKAYIRSVIMAPVDDLQAQINLLNDAITNAEARSAAQKQATTDLQNQVTNLQALVAAGDNSSQIATAINALAADIVRINNL